MIKKEDVWSTIGHVNWTKLVKIDDFRCTNSYTNAQQKNLKISDILWSTIANGKCSKMAQKWWSLTENATSLQTKETYAIENRQLVLVVRLWSDILLPRKRFEIRVYKVPSFSPPPLSLPLEPVTQAIQRLTTSNRYKLICITFRVNPNEAPKFGNSA